MPPASRRTGWSPAAWRPVGRPAWSNSPRRRRRWPPPQPRQPPLPPADELAAAVADLPALWSAPTTSDRDRKRVLRTLLGDITLRPGPTPHQLRVGLRWNSGATEELILTRMRPVTESRRAAPEAVALARELGPG